MAKRLLCLSTYPTDDASVRHRFLAYVPAIRDAGWEVRFESVVSERLFRIKNRTTVAARVEQVVLMVIGLLRRLAVLLSCGRFDVVWIHREAFPFLTPWAEEWVRRRCSGRVILDFDDALYAPPPGGRDWRSLFRRPSAFARVVSHCVDVVIAGSPELAEWATSQGATVVHIPTCVDVEHLRPTKRGPADPVTIGWIGSWSTAPYLRLVAEALQQVTSSPGVRLLLVGATNVGEMAQGLAGACTRSWSLAAEATDLAEFDIGIMPVPDTEWNRGKCAFKLIQYMAVGIPFVASPVGMNRELVRDAKGAGLGCETIDEWTQALRLLICDAATRDAMGVVGRAYACEHFDWRAYAPLVLAAIEGW